ncbi:MAG: hypothetical protein FD137_2109 [Spirochaetes bacterium]|nr:MAG: hypothetical protein FD137_2109 [Spirochaetota bacterium]
MNSEVGRPENSPEFTANPSAVVQAAGSLSKGPSSPGEATTWIMGRPKVLAKSQSRSSWAGTAMMAPVP